MMNPRVFFTHILTETDGQSIDFIRVFGALGAVTFLGMQIYSVGWKGQPFDGVNFGTGFGMMLGGLGTAMGVRGKFEGAGNEPRHDE